MRIRLNNVIKVLIYIYIGYGILYIPLVQLQLMFFDNVFINPKDIAIVVFPTIVFCLFGIATKNLVIKRKKIFLMIGLALLILNCLHGYIQYSVSYFDILNYFFTKIIPILLVILIYLSHCQIGFDKMLRFFKITAWLNIIFVYAQYCTNSVIWPFMYDNNGNQIFWSIESTDFTSLRTPGIMNSALSSGYIILALLMFLVYDVIKASNKKHKKGYCLKILLCLPALFMTQTRNIYFAFAFMIMYIILGALIKKRNILKVISVISVVLYTLLLVSVGVHTSDMVGIMSNNSTIIRIRNWTHLLSEFGQLSWYEQLLGVMKWQNSLTRSIFSDNLFIDYLFATGLIGLVIYLTINLKLQDFMLRFKNNEVLPIAALIASILIIGVANVPSTYFESIAYLSAALLNNELEYRYEINKEKAIRNRNP